jgi:hypothetical protein
MDFSTGVRHKSRSSNGVLKTYHSQGYCILFYSIHPVIWVAKVRNFRLPLQGTTSSRRSEINGVVIATKDKGTNNNILDQLQNYIGPLHVDG